MYKIKDLYDLNETIAAELFEGKEYPWEVLADIGDFILKLVINYQRMNLPKKVTISGFTSQLP